MIRISDVKLNTRYSVDFIYIEILFEETLEDFSNYTIDLYRSNANNEFDLIATDLKDTRFVDHTAKTHNTDINYSYQVVITDKRTNEIYKSIPYYLGDRKPDKFASYLNYNMDVYLERVIDNEEVYLFSRKRTGQLCPECYDEVRGRSQNDNCKICLGTNYVGGYHKPISMLVNYANPIVKSEQMEERSVGDETPPVSCWTLNFPVININDIIVNNNNQRFVVINIVNSVKGFHIFRQTITMHELPTSHPAYRLEVRK